MIQSSIPSKTIHQDADLRSGTLPTNEGNKPFGESSVTSSIIPVPLDEAAASATQQFLSNSPFPPLDREHRQISPVSLLQSRPTTWQETLQTLQEELEPGQHPVGSLILLIDLINSWKEIESPEARKQVVACFQELVERNEDKKQFQALKRYLERLIVETDAHTTNPQEVGRLYLAFSQQWQRREEWETAMVYASYAWHHGVTHELDMQEVDTALGAIELGFIRQQIQEWSQHMGRLLLKQRRLPVQEALTFFAHVPEIISILGDAPEMEQTRAHYFEAVKNVLDSQLQYTSQNDAEDFAKVVSGMQELAEKLATQGFGAQGVAWCKLTLDILQESEDRYDKHQHSVLCEEEYRQKNPAAAPLERPSPPDLKTVVNYKTIIKLSRSLRKPNERQSLRSSSLNYWQGFRKDLRELRESIKTELKKLPNLPSIQELSWKVALPIEALQERLTTGYKQLVAKMIKTYQPFLLMEAPCHFAFFGLGSMSRQDMAPYSDLEYGLLISDSFGEKSPEYAYFRQLCKFFEFAILSLGETQVSDHPVKLPSGFHIDPGARGILATGEIIATPEQLVSALIHRNEVSKNDSQHKDQDIAFSLLTPCLAYGEESLLNAYQKKLKTALEAPLIIEGERQKCNKRQYFGFLQLQADLKEEAWSPELGKGVSLDLKHAFSGPLNHLLTELGLIYGLKKPDGSFAQQPHDILEALSEKGHFTEDFLKDWRWSLAQVQKMRLTRHFQQERQEEEVDWQDIPPQEQTILQSIQQRLLVPLLTSLNTRVEKNNQAHKLDFLLQSFEALQHCDPPFEQLEKLTVASPSETQVRAASRIVASLIPREATVQRREATVQRCLSIYDEMMKQADPMEYASLWKIWREEVGRFSENQKLLKLLRQQPCPNGWRARWAEKQEQFYAELKGWFLEGDEMHLASVPRAWEVQTLNLDNPEDVRPRTYYLKPEIVEQLFEEGQPRRKPANQSGRHTVLPVNWQGRKYWIKIAPESAATEALIHALDQRLTGGEGTPHSLLLKLSVGNQTLAVQVQEEVGGENLEEILKTNPVILEHLNHASFTRTLLRTLLSNPEDDKGDDYFLVEQYNGSFLLRRIDNERAFYEADELGRFGFTGIFGLMSRQVQVKSQLYCLDQMFKELDEEVLKDFCRLDALELLSSWLADAEHLHKHYQSLFNEQDLKNHFARQPTSILVVHMADGIEKELLKRLDAMQGVIRSKLKDRHPVTGMDLLGTIQPTLCVHYEKAFQEHPVQATKPGAAYDRFECFRKLYMEVTVQGEKKLQSSWSGISAVSKSLRLNTDLTFENVVRIARGECLSPVQARRRMMGLTSQKIDVVIEELRTGKGNAKEHFRQLAFRHQCQVLSQISEALRAQVKEYTLEAQKRVLNAIAGVPFNELNLTAFAAVVNEETLLPLLQGAKSHLWKLDLSGCWQITSNSLERIAGLCPNLEKLILARLNAPAGTQQRVFKGLEGGSRRNVRFNQLRDLNLENCESLESFIVEAPQLKRLKLRGCKKLQEIRTGSRQLEKIDARDCLELKVEMLSSTTSAWEQVKKLQLKGANRLVHREFFGKYPWLVDDFFGTISNNRIEIITEALEQGIAGAVLTKSIKEKIRKNLATFIREREATVKTLINLLGQKDLVPEMTREAAAEALGEIGDVEDKRIISALHQASFASTLYIYGQATEALKNIHSNRAATKISSPHEELEDISKEQKTFTEQEISTLLLNLESPKWTVSEKAAKVLCQASSSQVSQIIPRLLRLYKAAWPNYLVQSILNDLVASHPDQAISFLIPALDDPYVSFRTEIARLCGKLQSEQASLVIPVLLEALKKDWVNDPEIRNFWDETAAQSEVDFRGKIAEVLGKIGDRHAEQIVPALLQILKPPSSWAMRKMDIFDNANVCAKAIQALGEIGGGHIELIVPYLIEALRLLVSSGKDNEEYIRRSAAKALGALLGFSQSNVIKIVRSAL